MWVKIVYDLHVEKSTFFEVKINNGFMKRKFAELYLVRLFGSAV